MSALSSWQVWALLSAVFAALTAIFAKVGVENINADFATFIRTLVVIVTLGFIVFATGQYQAPGEISGRTYLFLLLSGLGTGASWVYYFRALKFGQAAQVAPIDKLSVVLAPCSARCCAHHARCRTGCLSLTAVFVRRMILFENRFPLFWIMR